MIRSTALLLQQFKALADPVRARLVALCGIAECSVSELTRITGQSQPRVSQHLKQLCAVDLLERFRDGHFVYYRVPTTGADPALRRRLLSLLPRDEPQFSTDLKKLRDIRATAEIAVVHSDLDRSLHRALIELTVARPLGDLLDIGSGQGKILKLLASRAHRAVGVDVDSNARRLARAELLLAGTPNCTLRQGDMYDLPFADDEFDTVIIDDVLNDARDPAAVLREAQRLLTPGGRILLLASIGDGDANKMKTQFAIWVREANVGLTPANLRLAPPRTIPNNNSGWLLAVVTTANRANAAA